MTDLDELKHQIRTDWAKLGHVVIAAAVPSVAPSPVRVRQDRRAAVISSTVFDLDIVFSLSNN